MLDRRCESHNLSLQRFVIDDNRCFQLINCKECNSQLRQIWELHDDDVSITKSAEIQLYDSLSLRDIS
jgi:hypothetical protein